MLRRIWNVVRRKRLDEDLRQELDALCDRPPVLGLERQDFEDEKVQGALNQVIWFAHADALTVDNTRLGCRLSRHSRRSPSRRDDWCGVPRLRWPRC